MKMLPVVHRVDATGDWLYITPEMNARFRDSGDERHPCHDCGEVGDRRIPMFHIPDGAMEHLCKPCAGESPTDETPILRVRRGDHRREPRHSQWWRPFTAPRRIA